MPHLFTISKSKTIKYLLGVRAHVFMCACAGKDTINTYIRLAVLTERKNGGRHI